MLRDLLTTAVVISLLLVIGTTITWTVLWVASEPLELPTLVNLR